MKYLFSICLLFCICLSSLANFKDSIPGATRIADSLFNSGAYKDAIPYIEDLVKNGKTTLVNFTRLGFSYQNIGDYDKALEYYQKQAAGNVPPPALPQLYSRMAFCYAAKKDKANALEFLNKAATAGFFSLYHLNNAVYADISTDPEFSKIKKMIYNNAYPCMTDTNARKFDFWLGEWDVFLTSNQNVKVGTNLIESKSEGCAVLENWVATTPSNGTSINFYHPRKQKWEQTWMGSGQGALYFHDGEYIDGKMVFKWEGSNPNGSFIGRLTFHNFSQENKVRQHSEQSFDNGKTWLTVYDFTYIRKKK